MVTPPEPYQPYVYVRPPLRSDRLAAEQGGYDPAATVSTDAPEITGAPVSLADYDEAGADPAGRMELVGRMELQLESLVIELERATNPGVRQALQEEAQRIVAQMGMIEGDIAGAR